MKKKAQATFQVKGWDENPYHESEGGPKLTRATVQTAYQGDIEGEGAVEYLMVHRTDGTANFVGMERIEGRLGGRSGSFVLQHEGTFEAGTAKTRWSVVPGSGTGELEGLRGDGGFAAEHAQEFPVTLDYELD
jgi:hypothetical protein